MTKPEPSASPIGVLLVDDHVVILSALRMLLDSQPGMTVIGEAQNSAQALELAKKEQPEVVLLDLCIGSESGLDLIPKILEVSADSRILVLTGVQDQNTYRRAIRAGAMGVVSKEASTAFLLKAIDRVYAGELWLNRHATANLVTELRNAARNKAPINDDDRVAQLTTREREVIDLIAEGLKNHQIAERLFISETTVRHHLTSILRKLELSDRVELLIFAYRNNLVAISQHLS